jgi:hypothetical protein
MAVFELIIKNLICIFIQRRFIDYHMPPTYKEVQLSLPAVLSSCYYGLVRSILNSCFDASPLNILDTKSALSWRYFR